MGFLKFTSLTGCELNSFHQHQHIRCFPLLYGPPILGKKVVPWLGFELLTYTRLTRFERLTCVRLRVELTNHLTVFRVTGCVSMWLTKDSCCPMRTPPNHPNTLQPPHHTTPTSAAKYSVVHLMEGEQLVDNVNCLPGKQEHSDPRRKDTPCHQQHHTRKLTSQRQCLQTPETYEARKQRVGGGR